MIDMDVKYILEQPRGRANKRYIKKNYPEEYLEIIKYTGNTFPEQLYNYIYKSPQHICPVCGKDTPFRTITYGYSEFCSVECSYKGESRVNKAKQTCLKKYGVENPSQSDEIKKKKEETCLKNYGVKSGFNTDQSKNRLKELCLERYGVENPSQSDEIKKKKEETCLKNYGVTNSLKSERVRDALKNTMLEKYGVTNAFMDPNIRRKAIESKKAKFLNKWDLHIGYTDDGSWICKCPHKECNKCKDKQFIINQIMFHDRMRNETEICTKLLPPGTTNQGTTIELFIRDILDKYNIEYRINIREVISPKELDIYIPSKKLAIECNGIFWHSKKEPKYHLNKFLLCKENGIQLLTLWEDWIKRTPNIVESILLSKLGIYKEKIYARKCIIREVNSKICNQFLDNNHIQGRSNASLHYGLYYNNELVSIMTFSRSRVGVGKNEDAWELVRFCSKLYTQVIGGADKLFKYFLKTYNPSKVISYSSNDISNGGLYEKLKFHQEGPYNTAYWYIQEGSFERFHRYNFRKDKLKEMGYNTNNLTEREIMESLPYNRIYDSGTKRWVYCN